MYIYNVQALTNNTRALADTNKTKATPLTISQGKSVSRMFSIAQLYFVWTKARVAFVSLAHYICIIRKINTKLVYTYTKKNNKLKKRKSLSGSHGIKCVIGRLK